MTESNKHLIHSDLTASSARIHQHLGVLAATHPGGMAGAIKFCLTELGTEYDRMFTAVAAESWSDAARAAHNLGSISALVDITDLHLAARAAEAAFRSNDLSPVPQLLADTEKAFNRALQTLSALTG